MAPAVGALLAFFEPLDDVDKVGCCNGFGDLMERKEEIGSESVTEYVERKTTETPD
jgi:hypothetical protein